MADAVATQILSDGPKFTVLKLTNVSDGSGEAAVVKVDVSALEDSADGDACTEVVIERIWWQCIGMKVQILWNASTNLFCIELGEIKVVSTITPSLVGLQITPAVVRTVTFCLLL